MTDVKPLLYEICGNDAVYEDDCDLVACGLLDSLAIIELLSALEDEGIAIQITQIDRNRLRTPRSIQALVDEYEEEKNLLRTS